MPACTASGVVSAIWLGAGVSEAIADGVAAGLVVWVAPGVGAAAVALAVAVGAGVVVGAAEVVIGVVVGPTAVAALVGDARTVADAEPLP